jgi:hypothetical protein
MLAATARKAAAAGALALALTASGAAAQADLSTQGYGFPTGQFSTRALGSAGALGEIDPLSPINPATLSLIGTRVVYLQLEPEFRSVSSSGGVDKTNLTRIPVVFGALPVGSSWVLSLGSSTLLDRTSTTTFNTTQHLNVVDTVAMNTQYKVNGAMDDVRFAASWAPRTWLRLGAGAHAITGHNLVSITQSFTDSTEFSAFTQQRILDFSGAAVSLGVEFVTNSVTAAVSGRMGTTLHLAVADTALGSARVPSRFGASIAYTGLANSSIAIRTSHDDWSQLGGLGSPTLKGIDAWDTSIGADIAGPRFANRILYLRTGFRDRTLPFAAAGAQVRERSVTGGLGTTFANGRVLTDFALIRASRSADIAASEHAWTLSFGFTVRP